MSQKSKFKFDFPTFFQINIFEKVFNILLTGNSILIIFLLFGIFITLLLISWPAILHNGVGFLTKAIWDPLGSEYGAKSFLLGTFITAGIALLISTPFSLAISIFLGAFLKKGLFSTFFKSAIDLLAGIPSVIYGFWGLYVLVPIIRKFQLYFLLPPIGVGLLTAGIILSIMIIPYSASIAREVIAMCPKSLEEGAYSLGATKTETILKVILPYAKSGIFSGLFLALGRALGETMAVTMVIGNSSFMPTSLLSPGNSISSVIANEFAEASDPLYMKTLVSLGLLLFIVTTLISFVGRYMIRKWKMDIHEIP